MTKLIALKPGNNREEPGDVFEAPEAAAEVLIMVGAAKLAPDDLPLTDRTRPRRFARRRDVAPVVEA